MLLTPGDCDMAIAGGTNYLTLPDVFVHLCKAGLMSATGQCHSFGSQADGYARGEGCGIVLLKRLSHVRYLCCSLSLWLFLMPLLRVALLSVRR